MAFSIKSFIDALRKNITNKLLNYKPKRNKKRWDKVRGSAPQSTTQLQRHLEI
jgi:hypothetical protein